MAGKSEQHFIRWKTELTGEVCSAQKLHETIRKTYGLHTALLPLFSAATTAAIPHPAAPGIETLWKESILDSTVKSVDPNIRRSSAVEVNGEEISPEAIVSPTVVRVAKGRELSEEDLKSLRIFMREMVVQSILPWIERSVVVGNEQVSHDLLDELLQD